MENLINGEKHYYTKDFSSYSQTTDNFVANQELTVTITLNEYRDLIKWKAETEKALSEANSNYWAERKEKEKLEKQVEELKEKVYELREATSQTRVTGSNDDNNE